MANYKASIVFGFILMLSFALIISMGESKMTFTKRIGKQPILVCNKIYGAQDGDTCSSIIEAFHLSATAFGVFNPNLNCDKVFVGEWLCLDGITI